MSASSTLPSTYTSLTSPSVITSVACEPRTEDRADRVADLHVAREHQAVHGARDRGVAQVGLVPLERGPRLLDLRLAHRGLALRRRLLVEAHLPRLVRVLEERGRDEAVGVELAGPLEGALQEGQVGPLGLDLVPLPGGLRREEVRPRLPDRGLELLAVELGQDLALLHLVAVVHEQPLHEAARLRLDLDLGQGLDLPGRHDGAREVALLDRGEARGVDLLPAAAGRHQAEHREDHDPRADEDQALPALPAPVSVAVSVRHRGSNSLNEGSANFLSHPVLRARGPRGS